MVITWVLFPLVLLAACMGCGLAVEWVAGWRLPGGLLPAVGLGLIIVVATLTTSHSQTARFTTALVVALALAGYALSWRRLRRLAPDPWQLAVGLSVFIICAAPLVLSGNGTILGYFVDSDPAFHLVLINWFLAHGHDLTGVPASTYSVVPNVLHQYIGTAYPTGADVALGAIRPLVGQDVAWIFQPYLAVIMSLSAVALDELLRGVVRSRPLRAACAFIASQSGLAYAFYLEASIKEVTVGLLITLTVVLVVQTLARPLRLRAIAPLAITVVAGLDVYGAAVAPWLGIAVAAFVVTAAWRLRGVVRRQLTWRRIAIPIAGAVLLVAIALPVISGASTFVHTVNAVLGQSDELGNLGGPLKKWEIFGIWPNGDFRFPTLNYNFAYVLIGVALVGSVLGALWMLRRRTFGPLLLLAGDAAAAVFLLSRTSPYAAAKVLMLFSIAVVLTAMLGAVALYDAGRRIEGWILALVIGGGVLWTNALAFHDSSVVPQARFKELASIGSRFSGQGPAFYNLWDTYPIYFLRNESASIPDVNAGPVPGRSGLPPHAFGQASSAWDPNDLDPAWLQTNRLLILGRSPIIARPPANYQLAYRGTYYDVWRRAASPVVLEHIPLMRGQGDPPLRAGCPTIQAAAARAAHDHARLAYVVRAPMPTVVPTDAIHPATWAPMGKNGPPGFLAMGQSSGTLTSPLDVATSGDYTVWLQGTFSRRLIVQINGRVVGTIHRQIGTAGQFLKVGTVQLQAGEQRVDIVRPDSFYTPGNAVGGELLGPLVLVRGDSPPPVAEIAPGQARSLCAKKLEWIEIVR